MTRRPDGALETDVLRVLWDAGEPLLPSEINERLPGDYAYTSIATILTRLQAKGLVHREAAGRAYAYRAVLDESELAARRIHELLDSTSDRSLAISRFIGSLSPREVKAVKTMLERRRPSEGKAP